MFKLIRQHDQMDCGPACLGMIAYHYKKDYSLQYLRDLSFVSKDGVSMSGIMHAAQKIGFESFATRLSLEQLTKEVQLPCILHWNQNHFVVLYKIKKGFFNQYSFKIADPAHGKITVSETNFRTAWEHGQGKGVVMLLNPTSQFYNTVNIKKTKLNISYVLSFLKPYKKEVFQLFLGLLVSSLFTLIFPFLTQTLIDKGVESKSLNIILMILLAQLFLFLGSITIEIIRNWVTLYIGTRINITIISDFLKKILRLPIRFFDTKLIGDFHQRIHDHSRIESFLTSQSLTTFFSMFNFLIFFFVLLYYDVKIVMAYSVLTVVAILWSTYFLKFRKALDYSSFQSRSENQESIYELISGIQEIKLNSFEDYKREEWEKIQIKLFNINLKVLRLDQFQLIGFNFINQLKNILVTFVAAREVVFGNITLGSMLAISYIIGQMNSPINQLIDFFRSLQDARISLERLSEVQDQEEEEHKQHISLAEVNRNYSKARSKGIDVTELKYQYGGPKSPWVIKDLSFFIPEGKTTAIVGASGSGKTTLMKILLKFYNPVAGKIDVNGTDLAKISPKNWRKNCGVVMQEGYIFSDTIERNIATGDDEIDRVKLTHAMRTANIEEFVNSLPLKEKTKIGVSGNGISGGQKQRILIARAVYKNPHYIFFDEATSALDAENEKIIHDNLLEFFENKTVVIIAHRLSTVKNADQIIVLDKGRIVEQGSHQFLVASRHVYFNLVKNQLELGA